MDLTNALQNCLELLKRAESAQRIATIPPRTPSRLNLLEKCLGVLKTVCKTEPAEDPECGRAAPTPFAPAPTTSNGLDAQDEHEQQRLSVIKTENVGPMHVPSVGCSNAGEADGANTYVDGNSSRAQQLITELVRIVNRALELRPDSIFADEGGVPCSPQPDMACLVKEHFGAVCRYLMILEWLAAAMPIDRLKPPEREEEEEGAKKYIPQIAEVEEVVAPEPGSERLGAEILLDCCMYGTDSRLSVPWTSDEVGICGNRVVQTMGCRLEGCYDGAQCLAGCTQAAANLVEGARHDGHTPHTHMADESNDCSSPCCTGDGNGARQQLLEMFLPEVRDRLRQVIAKRRLKELHERMDYSPMPSAFEGVVAARRFTWLVCQLRPSGIAKNINMIIPTVCSIVDDSSPAVEELGVACLQHVATSRPRDLLLPWREVLLKVLEDAIPAAQVDLWPTLLPLAVTLTIKLEGRDPRQPGYDIIMKALLKIAEWGSNERQKRLAFMGAIGPLVTAMGLVLVKYFARLMPLLLEWVCAHDAASRLTAIRTLHAVVKHTWPRMPAHAVLIWDVLQRVYDQEKGHEERCAESGLEPSVDSKREVELLCISLVQCGGEKLIKHLKEAKRGASIHGLHLIQVATHAHESGVSDMGFS
eukprot:evm.model.scf_1932.3 EVM.evm.TU.scf_1932.3   scf_1932:22992-24926(+)